MALESLLSGVKGTEPLTIEEPLQEPETIRRSWANLSDEEIIQYVREHHQGERPTQLKIRNPGLFNHLKDRRRELYKLLQEKEILRRKKQFWALMSDEELMQYVKDHFQGKTRMELRESNVRLYGYLTSKRQELYREIKRQKILLSERKDWASLSDDELVQYVRKHHQGATPAEMAKNESGLYGHLKDRRPALYKLLLEEEVVLKRMKDWVSLSDEEIVQYVRNHFQGKTPKELRDADLGLYTHLIRDRREAYKLLLEEDVILKRMKDWASLSDDELVQYVRDRFQGKAPKDLREGEPGLYTYLKSKRSELYKKIKEQKILFIERKDWASLSDDELVQYVRDRFQGKAPKDLREDEPKLYSHLKNNRSGLYQKIKEQEILVRKSSKVDSLHKSLTELIEQSGKAFQSRASLATRGKIIEYLTGIALGASGQELEHQHKYRTGKSFRIADFSRSIDGTTEFIEVKSGAYRVLDERILGQLRDYLASDRSVIYICETEEAAERFKAAGVPSIQLLKEVIISLPGEAYKMILDSTQFANYGLNHDIEKLERDIFSVYLWVKKTKPDQQSLDDAILAAVEQDSTLQKYVAETHDLQWLTDKEYWKEQGTVFNGESHVFDPELTKKKLESRIRFYERKLFKTDRQLAAIHKEQDRIREFDSLEGRLDDNEDGYQALAEWYENHRAA